MATKKRGGHPLVKVARGRRLSHGYKTVKGKKEKYYEKGGILCLFPSLKKK